MSSQLDRVTHAERLSREQRWQPAAAQWRAVVEANPVHGAYWDRLAQALFETGDHAGALAAYRHAERLGVWPVPAPDRAPVASVHPGEIAYRIACCHARLGDTERALTELTRAVRYLRDPARAGADPDLAALRGDPRFRALLGEADRTGLARVEGWRADLRLLRQEVMRRCPAAHLLGEDFEAAADALDAAIADLDDVRIAVGLWGLLRRLGDGHAFLDCSGAYPQWQRCLPVRFYLFQEGLFIPDADPGQEHLVGAEVLAVDGRPVPQAIEALDPLLPRDNDYGPLAIVPVWLRQPVFLHAVGVADRPDQVVLTVRRPGAEPTGYPLPAQPEPVTDHAGRIPAWPRGRPPAGPDAGPLPAYLRDVDNPYWFTYLPGPNLVYFQFNAITEPTAGALAEFFGRLFDEVDAHDGAVLVIDLRWNGGGNTFLVQPLLHHLLRRERFTRRGTLFVIIGRGTYSAAQNTATLLELHTSAVFVGEPSGSSPNFIGETVPFELPYSGLRANVSDLYWQTSWPFDHRKAIPPDIYAPPTFAAYRDGRDVAMAAILDQLRGAGTA